MVQPPATIAWQVPVTQLNVQQSALALQLCPVVVHCTVPQVPLTQSRLQQSVGALQALPLAAHMPPEQTPLEHEPKQQSALPLQALPLAAQVVYPPSGSVSPPPRVSAWHPDRRIPASRLTDHKRSTIERLLV